MQTEAHPDRTTETWHPVAAEEALAEIDDWVLDDADRILADLLTSAEETVDEIVECVLDAADVEILEDIGAGPTGAAGPDGEVARAEAEGALLLRRLMVDILRRYRARQRRLSALGGTAS